jgi:hypothetical protein
MSMVDNKMLQRKKSKTSVRKNKPSKGGMKGKKPAQKKKKTR